MKTDPNTDNIIQLIIIILLLLLLPIINNLSAAWHFAQLFHLCTADGPARRPVLAPCMALGRMKLNMIEFAIVEANGKRPRGV